MGLLLMFVGTYRSRRAIRESPLRVCSFLLSKVFEVLRNFNRKLYLLDEIQLRQGRGLLLMFVGTYRLRWAIRESPLRVGSLLFSKVFGNPKRFASKSFYPSFQKGFWQDPRTESLGSFAQGRERDLRAPPLRILRAFEKARSKLF